MGQRMALYLQDKHDIQYELEIAKYAEDRGFSEIWQADARLARVRLGEGDGGHLPGSPARADAIAVAARRPHPTRHTLVLPDGASGLVP